MKNLKLLNKRYLSIILLALFFGLASQSEEPVDIWSVEEEKVNQEISKAEEPGKKRITENSIYKMQSQKENKINIEEDETLTSKKIDIVGLYDPAANGLDINMWVNSDGKKIIKLFNNINKVKLSKDASEILNIILLTNAHYPNKNISKKEFLDLKSEWLIKESNLKVIEDYLLNNQIINENPELTKYLVDDYLSKSEIKKACDFFFKVEGTIDDEYLSKFNIYCLINNNKIEEAQLLVDLKKEQGFKNKFYEKKLII